MLARLFGQDERGQGEADDFSARVRFRLHRGIADVLVVQGIRQGGVDLDLVVLAAEWGHGRRRGWLSNLHLGARSEDGSYVMLGKTFKGLTDDMLRWQTQAFLEREVSRDEWTVYLRPEIVVEIAFNELQESAQYPGGLALRFARVKRYRDDKTAAEADTMETVRAIHAGQRA